MTNRTDLKTIFIDGLRSLIYNANNPSHIVGSGWNERRERYSYKDGENANIALQAALKRANVIEDKPVYWLFTTVESKGSGRTTEDLHSLLKELPFLTFEKYHESEQFVNSNYFTGNYLKLHIYKVTQK